MRIRLLMVGKTRRPELRALVEDYTARIRRSNPVEVAEVRDAAAAAKKLDADRAATVVLLDAGGRQPDSEEFAKWLARLRDTGTRELVFLCGSAEGFPEELRRRAQHKLSLGAITLSHELARVVLAEQIYRALAILSGSPYPK
ncbi:MAG TPA: 23S rRNA (pseudouridine(1915)-N(3))-methyltransferase RlmH [Methylomirabilota bacterium]|nr:23S rRNA (pseudouridine(1915)-N(3))-methyltransferase RlmH [Methylomirabilota bacterium]